MYHNQFISVDLSDFGDGLYAKFLNPKLQSKSALQAQQNNSLAMLSKFPQELQTEAMQGNLDWDALPAAKRALLAPLIAEQMTQQDDLVAKLVVDWNVTDPFSDELLTPPRQAKDEAQRKDILERAPGEILQRIYLAIQEAMNAGPDPTSSTPSSS